MVPSESLLPAALNVTTLFTSWVEGENVKEDMDQRERELEGVKKELQQAISDKYVEIETLKDEKKKLDSDKEGEIAELKNQLESKTKEVDEIQLKLKSMEDFIKESKNYPQVIEEVKDLMVHKGFVSDKELDEILEKNLNE